MYSVCRILRLNTGDEFPENVILTIFLHVKIQNFVSLPLKDMKDKSKRYLDL